MRTSRKAFLTLALAGAALSVWGLALSPAAGQDRDHPESILPPGFGQPATPPKSAEPTPRTPAAAPAPAAPSAEALPAPETGEEPPLPTPTPTGTPTPVQLDPATAAYYELPPFARHDPATLGPVEAAGFAPDAFGRADGQFVERLMRRLSAPLPSRWLSIALRRLLLSSLDTPRDADGADFAAERAWLLLRMGESTGARALVQGVDEADYTPKLYQVALNAQLASGDVAGLCPLADGGVAATGERGWTVAQAMCAGLRGEPAQAQALIGGIRRRGVAGGVDLLLAQEVVGAGAAGREAITIEWTGVDTLTAWRYGLATATGVAIPDALVAAAGPQVRYWQALSPAVATSARVKAADAAAAQGVLSNAALVDLYGQLLDDDQADAPTRTAAGDLATAYAAREVDARVAALKRLWGDAPTAPYARLVLTARAAQALPVRGDAAGLDGPATDRLIASMLTAGLDRAAARWRPTVARGSDAWAMLALTDPAGGTLSYGDVTGYTGAGDAARKQRLLFAGLAGLGRLSQGDIERGAEALDVRIGVANSWTRALDRAATAGQPGTVLLLSAIGMQCGDWRGVPPAALYRIAAALRTVGLDGEARMIAAEAIARS